MLLTQPTNENSNLKSGSLVTLVLPGETMDTAYQLKYVIS